MRAFLVFLLTVGFYILAQGTGHPVLYHLFYTLASTLAVCYLWARLSLHGLDARRELLTPRTQVGRYMEEHLLVHNRSLWPKLWVEVQDMTDLPGHHPRFVTGLPARAMRHSRLRTICSLRGKYTLGPLLLRSSDPLGLFRLQKRLEDLDSVLVYPATEEVHGFFLPPAELPGGTATRRRTHHTTPNVSGVREYAPGDSFNRIHWPSTARQGRLIVKEFELDPSADIWIVLDLERKVQESALWRERRPDRPEVRTPASTEEYAVTAAASLARYFILSQRRNTGLIGWGHYREVIPPEREPRQFYRILESLATLRARGQASLAEVLVAESNRFGLQSCLVVITPSPDPEWVRAGLRDLLYGGIYAVVVLVDGLTFGGVHELDGVRAELTAHNVPYYILRNGEPIGPALSSAAGLVGWRQGAGYVGAWV
ncbi:MAG: DUF58 domain-containing protein [Chloroflexia bacterium]